MPYLDVCDDTAYSQRAKALHSKAAAAGVPAITTTGIYPGTCCRSLYDSCWRSGLGVGALSVAQLLLLLLLLLCMSFLNQCCQKAWGRWLLQAAHSLRARASCCAELEAAPAAACCCSCRRL